MKVLNKQKQKEIIKFTFRILGAVIFFLLAISNAFSDSETLLNNSKTSSPGYLNAAKARTDAILKQAQTAKKTRSEDETSYLGESLGAKLESADQTEPKLKKKESSENGSVDLKASLLSGKKSHNPGDVDGDNFVGDEDFTLIRNAWYTKTGDENYNEYADMNSDGVINILDFNILANNWGKIYESENALLNPSITASSGLDTAPSKGQFPIFSARTSAQEAEFAGSFKLLIKNKGETLSKSNQVILKRFEEDILDTSALAVPLISIDTLKYQESETPSALETIIKNPTKEQVEISVSLKELMDEIDNTGVDANGDLAKPQAGMLEVVAKILFAQAVPDLLSDKDIASIKHAFQELTIAKKPIISEYQNSLKMYYDSVLEALTENASALHLENILSKVITKEELKNLPRSEIDRILDKLRREEDKTEEEKRIIEKERQYRETYVAPAAEQFEKDISLVLRNFTRQLYGILEEADLVRKNTTNDKPIYKTGMAE